MDLKLFGLSLAGAVAVNTGFAIAADLAPPPAQQPPFSLHGFADLSLKNDYITPRGLLVTNKGATLQSLNGLVLDIYNNPAGFISDVSLIGGTWLDINPGYQAPNTNSFNEIDYFGGVSVKFGQAWTFGAQYVQFDSPQSAFFVERNLEFQLQYDDSGWNSILPLNPYVKLFYTFKGQSSTVVTGQTATFDVEIGAVPKYDLTPRGLPVILSAPTWFTVGPSEFWGGASNFGVFSTGLLATVPLPGIPAIGTWSPHWALHGGVRYYYELNDRLLLAQTLVGTAAPGTHRSVVVPTIGISMDF